MNRMLGLAATVLLAGTTFARNPTAGGEITSAAPAQAESATAQTAASGLDQVQPQQQKRVGYPVQGNTARAESGRTASGTTADSAERIGAEPTGVTPPVPAPTVGSTGGSVPYAH